MAIKIDEGAENDQWLTKARESRLEEHEDGVIRYGKRPDDKG